jgi:hypothetical protein
VRRFRGFTVLRQEKERALAPYSATVCCTSSRLLASFWVKCCHSCRRNQVVARRKLLAEAFRHCAVVDVVGDAGGPGPAGPAAQGQRLASYVLNGRFGMSVVVPTEHVQTRSACTLAAGTMLVALDPKELHGRQSR